MDEQVITPTRPPYWRPSQLADAHAVLAQLDYLRQVATAELAELAGLCTLRTYEAGTYLSMEGGESHVLFLVLQGSASVTTGEADGNPTLLSLLGRGDVFGEGGLFGLRYRRVSVQAQSRVYVLQIQYAELRPKLPQLPSLQRALRHLFRERLLQATLAHVPLFSSLNALERLALGSELDDQHFDRGATILHKGQQDLALHIIAEGQVQIVREGQTVGVLNPGDLFGEIEVMHEGPRLADAVALTPVHVLTIPISAFRQLLADHPNIAAGLQALVNRRYAAGHDQAQIDIVDDATKSGLVRGRKALARIPALCPPDCHLCEQACGHRFGVPRIRTNGVQLGAADVLHGCKHCTWSPECAEVCPTNAIKLDDDGFLFVNDRCTGCGACAEACPYDAITMIPLYPKLSGPLDWLLRRVKEREPLRLHPNKCDGCHGFADQACMSACPTGSLRWISVDDVLPHGYPEDREQRTENRE